jgi:cob(I)alamin adenosyltransferase
MTINTNGNFGLIHVYTGDGKGKTTAAMGLALRALGNGNKVHIIQLMKLSLIHISEPTRPY